MDEVLGQRPSIRPPVLIVSIPEDTPGPSAAVGDQEEQNEEGSEPAKRGKKRRSRNDELLEFLKEENRLQREAVAGISRCSRVSLLRAHSTTASPHQGVPASLWKLGKLNHVAIAVPDMEKATALYRDVLGASVSDSMPLPEHGVCTVFVELGNTKLELLHPLGEKSPISGFLQKNKSGGLHHICIEVEDINAAVADLKAKNIRTLSEEPRIGAHGKPVVFLHPKDCDGVLVELEEA